MNAGESLASVGCGRCVGRLARGRHWTSDDRLRVDGFVVRESTSAKRAARFELIEDVLELVGRVSIVLRAKVHRHRPQAVGRRGIIARFDER